NQYYNVTYRTEYVYSDEEFSAMVAVRLAPIDAAFANGQITQAQYDFLVSRVVDGIPRSVWEDHNGGTWHPDAEGNYSRATHPCFNGEIQGDDVVSCQALSVNERMTAEAQKRKDHGWVPHFGIGYRLTDTSRMYLRYTEMLRYPSMFESTIGFSASLNPWGVKPEHARNWELAYIQDLTPWFPKAEYADLKLTYYHNDIRDVIERDNYFNFRNIERQLLRGIELDGRYDTGGFFTSLGLNYSLENKVCDEHTAAILSNGRWNIPHYIPSCFKYGYPNGYLLAQAAPDLSINWTLGGRFLNRKLELGSRFTWHKAYKNSDLENYTRYAGRLEDGSYGFIYFANTPFSWDETLLVDAYAHYKINDNLSVELVGTNLTDLYYVDPTTRSPVAAPGRTLKLSLTGRF
ncbi:TonB-dependent receptor domain-containing protein, partial [Nitrincola lacisaponensis]